jgi:hypothetical protein
VWARFVGNRPRGWLPRTAGTVVAGAIGWAVARYAALFGLNLILVAVSVPLMSDLLGHVLADRGLQLLGAKVVVTAALLLFNSFAYHHWVFKSTPITTDPGMR